MHIMLTCTYCTIDKLSQKSDSTYESQLQNQKSMDGAPMNPCPNTQPRIPVPPPPIVKPLFELTEDGNVIGTFCNIIMNIVS